MTWDHKTNLKIMGKKKWRVSRDLPKVTPSSETVYIECWKKSSLLQLGMHCPKNHDNKVIVLEYENAGD